MFFIFYFIFTFDLGTIVNVTNSGACWWSILRTGFAKPKFPGSTFGLSKIYILFRRAFCSKPSISLQSVMSTSRWLWKLRQVVENTGAEHTPTKHSPLTKLVYWERFAHLVAKLYICTKTSPTFRLRMFRKLWQLECNYWHHITTNVIMILRYTYLHLTFAHS